MLALVQAPGFVDPHPIPQPCLFDQLLQPGVQFALSVGCAARPRRVGRPCVVANKYMVLKSWQSAFLLKNIAAV
jgi:hypothetical protein